MKKLGELGVHIIRKLVFFYVPISLLALPLLFLLRDAAAFPSVLFFIIIQAIVVEIDYFFHSGAEYTYSSLDISPLAALYLAYYHSWPAAILVTLACLLVQDHKQGTNVFAEFEDFVFTVIIIAVMSVMRDGSAFIGTAISLLLIRYFVIAIAHAVIFRDFSPKKFSSEVTSCLIMVAVLRVLNVTF